MKIPILIRLEPEQLKHLKSEAKRLKVSIAEIIRFLIEKQKLHSFSRQELTDIISKYS